MAPMLSSLGAGGPMLVGQGAGGHCLRSSRFRGTRKIGKRLYYMKIATRVKCYIGTSVLSGRQ
ncbi:hypothetical protein LCGC14_0522670 [marine sediment metagenome]|uniref:Uncharacterized protein n=1 Tax=marine sediment metagenome TaxID=412755 RepID=A0A0F9RY15_9ZZZZ